MKRLKQILAFAILACAAPLAFAQVCSFPPCLYDQTTVDPNVWSSTSNYQGSGTYGLLIPSTRPSQIGLNFARLTAGPTDVADFFFHRTANYSGGSAAVNAALYSKTVVSSGALGYEWTGVFYMDNSSTLADASQNLALAAVAVKHSSGNTWARYAEIDDDTQDSTGGTVGDELDVFANGTQANNNRLILHTVIGPKNYGGTAHIYRGIRMNPQVDNGGTGTSNGMVDDAWISLSGDYKFGLDCQGGYSQGSGGSCLHDARTSSPPWGIQLLGAYTSGAIQLSDNKNIVWSSDQSYTEQFQGTDRCLETRASTIAFFYNCIDGTLGVGTTRPPASVSAPASFYVNKLGLPLPQFHFGIAVFLPSSGTFTTTPSASGLTLTTAITGLTSFCSTTVGCYMYFPANAINGSNTAGAFFTTCTSTTVCSVFNNGLAGSGAIAGTAVPTTIGSPTSFGTVGGGAYTQTTGSQLILVAVSVAANSLGNNGGITIDAQYGRISNANAVVPQFVWGGVNLGSFSSASQQWIGMHRNLHNQGATNSQFAQQGSAATDVGAINAAPAAVAIDTTVANTLAFKCQLTTAATDWCILMSGDVVTNFAP